MSSNQKTVQSVGQWPEDVGILAMEVYFPSTCVAHSELEQYDGVGSGKYTIGLGQTHMGFCGDQEDINSLCLTAVKGLVDKAGISYSDIGRLEVGTETILDKSKSVKTVLMKLFATSGNSSVDGIDTTNACYGGTQALFNAVAWVESSLWDGRLAVVVAADIAVYASGSARPTGGAGAVAMLIGPKAPLVMERGLRGVHMEHTYDFYKPDLSSEYPVVDGKLSIQCYLTAVDNCYKKYVDKASTSTAPFSLQGADFFVFHSPFTKLVVKSLARLLLNDFVRCPTPDTSEGGQFAGLSSLTGRTLEDTLGDRVVEKLLVEKSSSLFKEKTQPSVLLGTEVGNMYTASVYGGLASLLVSKDVKALCGKRVVLFSYGSGLAAAMYSFKVCDTPSPALSKLLSGLSDIPQRLSARTVVPPAKFEAMMKLRQDTHHKAPYVPETSIDGMFPGTFYLTNVDDKHRRSYNEVAMATTLSNGIQ